MLITRVNGTFAINVPACFLAKIQEYVPEEVNIPLLMRRVETMYLPIINYFTQYFVNAFFRLR